MIIFSACGLKASWNLECFVQWKPYVIVRKDEYDDEYGGSEEQDGTVNFDLKGGSKVVVDDRIRRKVSYLTNSFVAVKENEDNNNVPMWIGKVLSTTSDGEGNVCTLLVHWYHSRSSSKWMTGRYYQSFQDRPAVKVRENGGKIISVQTQS